MGKLQQAREERDQMVNAFCNLYSYLIDIDSDLMEPAGYIHTSAAIKVVKKFVDEEGNPIKKVNHK